MVDAVILLTELTVTALALELICLEVSVGPSWRQIASLEHERIVGLGQSLGITPCGNWTTRGFANSRIANSRTGQLAD